MKIWFWYESKVEDSFKIISDDSSSFSNDERKYC
jgi:hypothetical protein